MSSKAKKIVFSVAAILAVAGGVYAFMPGAQEKAADSAEVVGPAQTAAKPEVTDAQGGPSSENADVPAKEAVTAQEPAPKDQPTGQAPKKLTKQQLTPPPLSEEEKLQKAAQQESNF